MSKLTAGLGGVFMVMAVLVVGGCASASAERTSEREEQHGIVGAWRSKVQFSSGAFAAVKDLEFMYVFNDGGTMTESSNYDASPPVPPAYGAWREVRPGQLEAKYVFYMTRPPAKFDEIAGGNGWSPSGYGELTERITLSSDGQWFTSTIRYEPFDTAGKPAEGGGTAEGHGRRIKF
jgi:hypothetical protein